MSNRRDPDRSHGVGPRSDATTGADSRAPSGSTSGGADGGTADDFWGDVPDWSGQASTSRRTGLSRIGSALDEIVNPTPIGTPVPRVGLGVSLGRAWDQLLGAKSDTTREHRRIEPSEPLPDAVVADFADFDEFDGYDDVASVSRSKAEPAASILDDTDETRGPDRTPVDRIKQGWVAEETAVSNRSTPIDPLFTRIGALIIVTALIVPLLLSTISSGSSGEAISSASDTDVAAADLIRNPAPALVSPNSTDETSSSSAIAPVDPASLPPAIPVNTEGSTDASTEAAGEAEGVAASATASSAAGVPSSASSLSTKESTFDVVDSPADADESAARVDPPICPVLYAVVEGDFWLRLVDAADVDLADLLAINGATINTPLYPGNEICLPEGATTPDPPVRTTQAPTVTTSTPTTTPQVPTTEPPGPDDIKQIVRDVWPDELEERALEIAYRESRFVPTAKNFCCYGLFQIYWEVHDVWLDDIGITSASQLYDPETNARAAYALYQRAGGWGPWKL